MQFQCFVFTFTYVALWRYKVGTGLVLGSKGAKTDREEMVHTRRGITEAGEE